MHTQHQGAGRASGEREIAIETPPVGGPNGQVLSARGGGRGRVVREGGGSAPAAVEDVVAGRAVRVMDREQPVAVAGVAGDPRAGSGRAARPRRRTRRAPACGCPRRTDPSRRTAGRGRPGGTPGRAASAAGARTPRVPRPVARPRPLRPASRTAPRRARRPRRPHGPGSAGPHGNAAGRRDPGHAHRHAGSPHRRCAGGVGGVSWGAMGAGSGSGALSGVGLGGLSGWCLSGGQP